jgi:hypothetical protein
MRVFLSIKVQVTQHTAGRPSPCQGRMSLPGGLLWPLLLAHCYFISSLPRPIYLGVSYSLWSTRARLLNSVITCARLTGERLDLIKMTVFWVVAPCNVVEVYFYQTTRWYNPEDSHLHTHRRENLKSYLDLINPKTQFWISYSTHAYYGENISFLYFFLPSFIHLFFSLWDFRFSLRREFWDDAPCSLVEVYHPFRVLTASDSGPLLAAESTPEPSVNFYQTTRRNIPKASHLRSFFFFHIS